MIDVKDIMLGDWCCFLTGKDNDRLSMPMQVCLVSEGEVYLTFDENEADPWICEPVELMPIAITPAILEKNGWFTKDGAVWFKKGPVRMGWYKKNCEFIAGYHTMPFIVEFVHQLQHVIRLLGMEEDIIL